MGSQGRTAAGLAASPLVQGPWGVGIVVNRAAWHGRLILATTRSSRAYPSACDGRPRPRGPSTGGESADREGLVTAPRAVPDLSDTVDVPGCVGRAEPVEQPVALLTRSFRYDLYSAVAQIDGETAEAADLQSVCPGEPAKANSLYSAAHPNSDSHFFIHVRKLTGRTLGEPGGPYALWRTVLSKSASPVRVIE